VVTTYTAVFQIQELPTFFQNRGVNEGVGASVAAVAAAPGRQNENIK